MIGWKPLRCSCKERWRMQARKARKGMKKIWKLWVIRIKYNGSDISGKEELDWTYMYCKGDGVM